MNNGGLDLPLAVVGCDFRVASSVHRSKLVLTDEQALQIAQALRDHQATEGFVDLNTCNRNEWIVSGPDPRWAAELLRSQMIARVGEQAQDWFEPYVFTGEQAAIHLLQVAIGQKSLVVGERQIAGQLYRALERARDRCTSSRILNGLGTVAGRLVRIALRRNCIGNAAVGVHSLAIGYLLEQFPGSTPVRVALVGLGRIGKRIMGILEQKPRLKPTFINRSISATMGQTVRPLNELPRILANSDAAIICTGACEPILDKTVLNGLDRDLLLIDIGIPEQVDQHDLPKRVRVSGLDDLTDFYHCTCNLPSTANHQEVDSLIQKALNEFRVYCHEPTFTEILDTVQKHHSQLVHEEIPKLIRNKLSYLPEQTTNCLEQDLRSIVLEYTSEVFRTIKEASLRMAEGDKCQEP